jgi:hypothetical protein
MSLPEPLFTAANLTPGRTYRVKAPFTDYDGDFHPVGETWRFVEKTFLPYEDGLMLFTEHDGRPWTIRLQWREETQGQIIDRFADFVEALSDGQPGGQLTAAGENRKTAFWKHIATGAAILSAFLCLAAVALILVMEYEMGYRPSKASNTQARNIAVSLGAPFSVAQGQDFSLIVQVANQADHAQKLDSIQINTGYLGGATVQRSDPPYASLSQVKRSEEFTSFRIPREIPAHSTLQVTFYLTATKAGDYAGQVLVCIDTSKACLLHYTHTVVK